MEDTRPVVTVVGVLNWDVVGWYVSLDAIAIDLGHLQAGDEVEVTMRKPERTTGNLLADSAWAICPGCGLRVLRNSIEAGHRPDCREVPVMFPDQVAWNAGEQP